MHNTEVHPEQSFLMGIPDKDQEGKTTSEMFWITLKPWVSSRDQQQSGTSQGIYVIIIIIIQAVIACIGNIIVVVIKWRQ